MPIPREVLWPSPEQPLYRVTLELEVMAGRFECVAISIRGESTGRVISRTTLGKILIHRLVACEVRKLQSEVSAPQVYLRGHLKKVPLLRLGIGRAVTPEQQPTATPRHSGALPETTLRSPRGVSWPSPERPLYWVTLELDVVAGRLDCVAIGVRAEGKGRVVRGVTMRELPIGRLVAAEARKLQNEMAALPVGLGQPSNATDLDDKFMAHQKAFWVQARQYADELAPIIATSGPEARQRRYPPDHLKKVAQVYREALSLRRDPTAAVGDLFRFTHSTAPKQVSRARQRGYLPPARPGYRRPPG